MNIGTRVIQLREERGITQYSLAKTAKVAQPSLLDIERNKTTPNVKTLHKLCIALGITLEEFFSEDSQPDPVESELLSAFRQLDDEKKQQAIRVVRSL